jgi:hypothetical protein
MGLNSAFVGGQLLGIWRLSRSSTKFSTTSVVFWPRSTRGPWLARRLGPHRPAMKSDEGRYLRSVFIRQPAPRKYR